MTLAELVAQRLERAGIAWDDPGLVQLREHNRLAQQRQADRARLDELADEMERARARARQRRGE